MGGTSDGDEGDDDDDEIVVLILEQDSGWEKAMVGL